MNTILQIGRLGLHHLRVPAHRHLPEKGYNALEAPGVADRIMQPDAHVKFRPSPIEFEMAYQVRVAIDSIPFAIKATDQFPQHCCCKSRAYSPWTHSIHSNQQSADFSGAFGPNPRTVIANLHYNALTVPKRNLAGGATVMSDSTVFDTR